MPRITDSRAVLAVRDLTESTRFFIDMLGFRRDFGDGSDGWSFLSRDNFKVRLGECPDERPASELGNHSYIVYLTVEGLDQLHQELCERGAPVISEPEDQPWGMREFSICTPDGHRLRFGEPVTARQSPEG
jgi:catechol 2,3-dioxygenase-like lactoylglutathione lyase family enzyme